MSAPRTWPGTPLAHGVWLPPGTPDVPARLLPLWTADARVGVLAGGVVVLWTSPRRLPAREAPGLPLVRVGGGWSAVVDVAVREDEVVVAWAGRVERAVRGALGPLDVSTWIALDGWAEVSVAPLGGPAAPSIDVPSRSVREVLGRPPAGDEVAAELRALQEPGPAPAWRRAVASALAWLSRRTPALGSLGASGPRGTPGLVPRRSWVPTWLTSWLQRLAEPLVSGRMRALLELLERDLDEALRRLPPLASPGASGASGLPSWGATPRRADLTVSRGQGAAGGTIGLAGDVYETLRQSYLATVERLLARQRLDDAVFVLAELLGDFDRAVSLLEGQGRWREAAELAEQGVLSTDRVVRLWLRADDLRRAVVYTRRTGDFAAALARIAAESPEDATALRFAWAHELAAAGAVVEACVLACSDPRLRALALRWFPDAVAVGSPSAFGLLGTWLAVEPEALERVRGHVTALIADPSPDAVRARLMAAEGLARDGEAAGWLLARALVRRSLLDLDAHPGHLSPDVLRRHVAQVGDSALETDLPSFVARPRAGTVIAASLPAHDVGLLTVFDALMLPDGSVVVALGDGGVRVYARDGELRCAVDAPCDVLVSVRGTNRVLAIAERSFGHEVRVVDARRGTAQWWHAARYRAFARETAHGLWLVGDAHAVFALDLADLSGARALWKLRDLTVRSLDVVDDVVFVQPAEGDPEVYSLPAGRRLASRDAVLPIPVVFARSQEPMPASPDVVPDAAGGAWVVLSALDGVAVSRLSRARVLLAGARFANVRMVSRPERGPVVIVHDDRGRVLAFDFNTGQPLADLRVV